jgi:hypothetical protein
MKLPNLKKYANFDEYIKRNDIEVLSFNDGIAARWKSFRRYKSWGHRVTETTTSQLIGNNPPHQLKKLFRGVPHGRGFKKRKVIFLKIYNLMLKY